MSNQAKFLNNGKIRIEASLVLDCLDIEVMIITDTLEIVYANKAFLKNMNVSQEEALGNFCYRLTHHLHSPCQPPNDPCPIKKLEKSGQPVVETHLHKDKNANILKVNVSAIDLDIDENKKYYLHLALPVSDKSDPKEEMLLSLEKTKDIFKVIRQYQNQVEDISRRTKELEQIKNQLEDKIEDLEKFNKIAIGRELKMIELKKKLAELEAGRDNDDKAKSNI